MNQGKSGQHTPQPQQTYLLPERYRILPESIPLIIPGFERYSAPEVGMLVPEWVDSRLWYEQLIDEVVAAIGKRYLPICRLGDGEFMFMVGREGPSIRLPWFTRLQAALHWKYLEWRNNHNFLAETQGRYQSGQYSLQERLEAMATYGQHLKAISEMGRLAPLLSYCADPFQEPYFPPVKKWFEKYDIQLNLQNSTAFYYVYAMLTGLRSSELIEGRRILIVTNADDSKQAAITHTLTTKGASQVYFCQLSTCRSLFDSIDVSPWIGKVDIVMVGAGIGKPGIMLQMQPLNVPCIDAGFVIEVWNDPAMGVERSFCMSDNDFEAMHRQASDTGKNA